MTMKASENTKIDLAMIAKKPFNSYNDYMTCMFAVVNDSMDTYIEENGVPKENSTQNN